MLVDSQLNGIGLLELYDLKVRTPAEQSSADGPAPSGWTSLTIVRHACAVDKQTWPGDDSRRPLDAGGIRQADALAEALADASLQRLVTSPTKRCMDPLRPLAARLQLKIETTRELSPDGSIDSLLSGQHPKMSGTIICTHGELMKPLLERLQADRVEIDTEHDEEEWLLSKGSAWRLMLDPYGRIMKLTHETPLPLPDCEAHATSG